jgi:hypothetical protein
VWDLNNFRTEGNIMPTKTDRNWIPWQKLPTQEAARRRKAAFTAIRKLFAEVVPLWASCGRGQCRRHRHCAGKIRPCLARSWPLLSSAAQNAAHNEVMKGGPRRLPAKTRSEWELRGFPPSNFVH